MSSINYVDSIKLTCSRITAPDEKFSLTLTGNANKCLVEGKTKEGEPSCILCKGALYQAVFEKNIFQNDFSGLQVSYNGNSQDVLNANYAKEENRLYFAIKIPLKRSNRTLETIESDSRITLFIKDGISNLIQFNGNIFILKSLLSKHAQRSITVLTGAKNSSKEFLPNTSAQPSISPEMSPRISPTSLSPTSTDETAGIPLAGSIEFFCSRKDSNDKVKIQISAKQSNKCVVYDESSKTAILSKHVRYKLTKFQAVFKSAPSIFVHKEDELIYLPNRSYVDDELTFQIDIGLLDQRRKTSYSERSTKRIAEKAQQNAVRLYFSGKNAQGEEVLLRTDGHIHLLSKLQGPQVLKVIKGIFALKEKNLPFSEEWPEVIPSNKMPKIFVGLSQTSVSNVNSITPQQLKIQEFYATAKKSLLTTAKEFNENGKQEAAAAVFALAKAFTSVPLNNVNEAKAVMSLLTQVGNTFIKSLDQTEVLTVQEVEEEQGSETDEDTFEVSTSGKAEESGSEGSESDGEESDHQPIKIRKINEDTSVHSKP